MANITKKILVRLVGGRKPAYRQAGTNRVVIFLYAAVGIVLGFVCWFHQWPGYDRFPVLRVVGEVGLKHIEF